MASQGWNRSGTQFRKVARADIPNVNSTSATTVPSNPQSTVTRETPTAVAKPRRRINTKRTQGGSAVRKRDGFGGSGTALSNIWMTLAWISTPAIARVGAPKLVVASCSSLTPARSYATITTLLSWRQAAGTVA